MGSSANCPRGLGSQTSINFATWSLVTWSRRARNWFRPGGWAGIGTLDVRNVAQFAAT